MEYRILGPLTVTRDGVALPIRGRHRPRLLAMLLLEAGRVVTVSRLVAGLWDEDPPDTARRQVQNNLAALRRALGPEAIAATADGYRLETDAAEIDSLRFQELASRAREAARQGRHASAHAGFEAALDLWRGEALSGLTGRAVEAAAARWEEQRLAVVEERAEAGLALGRYAAVVEELREALRRWPFRQRMVELSMRGLWGLGRGGEAVAVYEDLRERLGEELGIDPDAALGVLRERIERGAGAAAPVRESVPVPAQLPGDVSTFTGRAELIEELDRLSEAGSTAALSAVSGMGGVGKTALAVHWGHLRRRRFPDGQLYLNLRGYDEGEPMRPHAALTRLLLSLGVGADTIPDDVAAAAALYRSLLERRRCLILLDNAGSADQVRSLLPGPGPGMAVVTSRDRLAGLSSGEEVVRLDLGVLPTPEARALLTELIGADRVAAEPEALSRLVELSGRLPLTLRIIAANVSESPGRALAEFVEQLAANRLAVLAIGGDSRADLAATLALSVDALSAGARRLLGRLAQIPGADFNAELAVVLGSADPDEATAWSRQLVSANLVEEHQPGRHRLHDLVREYARQRLDPGSRSEVRSRIIDWHFEQRGHPDNEDRDNLIATFEAFEDDPRAWRLTAVLSQFVYRDGDNREIWRVVRRGLRSAEQHEDVTGRYFMNGAAARVLRMLGDLDGAVEHAGRVLEWTDTTEARDPVGVAMGNLGLFLFTRGDFLEAEHRLRRALELGEESGMAAYRRSRAANLGNLYRCLGRFAEAEELIAYAVAVAESEIAGDKGRLALVDSVIDQVDLHLDMGRLAAVAAGIESMLAESAAVASVRHEAAAYARRGELNRRRNRLSESEADLGVAVELALATGNVPEARYARLQWALTASRLGRHETAWSHTEAAAVDDQTSNLDRGDVAHTRCAVTLAAGDFAAALRYGAAAEAAFAAMPFPLRRADVLRLLAEAHTGLGHHTQAELCRRQSHTVFRRLGVPVPETSSDARPR